jgi:two-component system chemotaxis response regulator CheB
MNYKKFQALVIGGSAGSLNGLLRLFSRFRVFRLPVIIGVHLHPNDGGEFVAYFASKVTLPVREVVDKEKIQGGTIYFSPANYHLLVERDATFSLSIDGKVNYSRPSIDVLFDSAAAAWGEALIGIILTGASADGAAGIRSIKRFGGLTIAQSPEEAEFSFMPGAAINTGCVDKILTINQMVKLLLPYARENDAAPA